MTTNLAIKACSIWIIIAVFAIANGIFREKLLVPNIGQTIALPLSGITLSILVFLIAYFSIPFFGKNSGTTFLFLGLQWVLMTILFEFIFGHFVAEKSWEVLLQRFNILEGDLFVFALLVSLLSPYFAARLRAFL